MSRSPTLFFYLLQHSLAQRWIAVDLSENLVVARYRQSLRVERALDLGVGLLLDLFLARRIFGLLECGSVSLTNLLIVHISFGESFQFLFAQAARIAWLRGCFDRCRHPRAVKKRDQKA